MCLGVPAMVVQIMADNVATVDVNGNRTDISIRLVPEASVGDFVLVHAGFAMEIIDEAVASETISYMEAMGWYDR